MIKSNIIIALRSFWKHKLITGINIFGLSIGIACAGMAYIFIQHELSFDRFHDEHEQIYWLHTSIGERFNLSTTPDALAPALAENFPEVSEYFRLEDGSILVESSNEIYKEKSLFVEGNFFEFFNFELLKGNPETAFEAMNSVVLSHEMSQKHFGRQDPIGKALSIVYNGEQSEFQVTGVSKKVPSNSSIQFDFLIPIEYAHKDDIAALNTNWNDFNTTSFIRLRSKNDLNNLAEQLPSFALSKYEKGEDGSPAPYLFTLNALDDYHLNEAMFANGLSLQTDKSYVNILGIIAILILLVACLNFTNLSNARGSQRLTEIGVRQVMGAGKRQLSIQFLIEFITVSLLALILAIVLIKSLLHFTTQLFDYPLSVDWQSPGIILPLIGISLTTGLLAGAYPAFLLSSLKPVNTFQSNFKIGGNNWVTKAGLIFQFGLSIALLSCTFIMFQQNKYISQRNLGFDKEAIVVIPTQIQGKDAKTTDNLLERYRSEILGQSDILNIAGVSYSFTRGNMGRAVEEAAGFNGFIFEYRVDPNYLDLLNIELIEGRSFSEHIQEDKGKSLIVNETFIKQIVDVSKEDFRLPEKNFEEFADARIVGVVKDYNFLDLKSQMRPMMLHMKSDVPFHHFMVKIAPENIQQTLSHLKSSWQKVNPDKPFEFSFLDEDLQRQYIVESRWSNVISAASILAIVIAFLGLFGLVALSLTERTKEIGIRKVLGASVINITTLFSGSFLKLIGVALLIATPVSWYFMQEWLQSFVYRVDIQWWVFVLAGIVTVLIALMTIGVQSIKAAFANPVDSLRQE